MLTAGSPCCIQRDFPFAQLQVAENPQVAEFSKLQVAELLDGTQKVKMARLGGEIAEGKIICRWSTFQKLQVASLGGETAGGGVFRWLTDPAGGLPCWKNC